MAPESSEAFMAFKNLLEITNQLERAIDKGLEQDNLTAKQFKMMAAIDKGFDHRPSIKEVAVALNTSHQNVKEMANQLVRRGFLTIERDETDKRILRLRATEKNAQFWEERQIEHERFMLSLFACLSLDELRMLNHHLLLLSKGISEYIRG